MNLLYRRNIMYLQQPYFLWLGRQAVQAIVAAFGQTDGLAVIEATNVYLTQLAASDRDKATALAGFINQYPLYAYLVYGQDLQLCEYLGVTDATSTLSYIDTGVKCKTGVGIHLLARQLTTSRINISFFGSMTQNEDILSTHSAWFGFKYRGAGGSYPLQEDSMPDEVEYEIKCNEQSNIVIWMARRGTITNSGTININTVYDFNSTCSLFVSRNNNQWPKQGASRVYICDIFMWDKEIRRLYPCYRKSDGVIGMYDVMTGTFYTNAGTGSFNKGVDIAPENTPWTPSTP